MLVMVISLTLFTVTVGKYVTSLSKNICTRRKKKRNSHYAPQTYTTQSVYKSLLN